ncbi:response regulator transcription factor [Pseudomonas solani]|uniref:response regulator n=1 Tax=Pseudomonas solani TaxID=2731552 RepID=UPI0035BE9DC8
MAKILLIDDHPIVRMAARMLLEREGHQVVGEAADGVTGLSQARETQPRLVLLDLDIPALGGLELIARLRSLEPVPSILVLSAKDPGFYAARCLRAGAHGYVYKREDMADLVTGVKAVLAGYRYFPDAFMTTDDPNAPLSNEAKVLDSLSDRELTVLRYLALGYTNKQIADQILINNKTVSSYKARLQEKVGEQSLVGLVEFAKRNGVV